MEEKYKLSEEDRKLLRLAEKFDKEKEEAKKSDLEKRAEKIAELKRKKGELEKLIEEKSDVEIERFLSEPQQRLRETSEETDKILEPLTEGVKIIERKKAEEIGRQKKYSKQQLAKLEELDREFAGLPPTRANFRKKQEREEEIFKDLGLLK